MSHHYTPKPAIPVQPRRPRIKVSKKPRGQSEGRKLKQGSLYQSSVASYGGETASYVVYVPAPPKQPARPAGRPTARPGAIKVKSPDKAPHPPPTKKNQSPSRRNIQNIMKLREEILAHHRADKKIYKIRDDVGTAVRAANSVISNLSEDEDEPQTSARSRKGYNNAMFEFYRREAAAASAASAANAARQRHRKVGATRAGGGKPASLSMLPVYQREEPIYQRGGVVYRHAGLYADAPAYDEEPLPRDERYRVGKVADRTIETLNDEISATVADCQRTVEMLARLGRDSPSAQNLLFGPSLPVPSHAGNSTYFSEGGSPDRKGYGHGGEYGGGGSFLPNIFSSMRDRSGPASHAPNHDAGGVVQAGDSYGRAGNDAPRLAPGARGGLSLAMSMPMHSSSPSIVISSPVAHATNHIPSFKAVAPQPQVHAHPEQASAHTGAAHAIGVAQAGESRRDNQQNDRNNRSMPSSNQDQQDHVVDLEDDEASVLNEARRSLADIEMALSRIG